MLNAYQTQAVSRRPAQYWCPAAETQSAYPKLWLVILLAFVVQSFLPGWPCHCGAYSLLNKARSGRHAFVSQQHMDHSGVHPGAVHRVGCRRTAVSLLLSAPLAAILLVAVVGTADPYLIALMCLSTVTAMFVGAGVKRLMARRAAGKAAATSATE